MTFEFPCDGCGRVLRVGSESEGSKVRCPGCGTVSVAAPLAEDQVDEEILEAEDAEDEPRPGEGRRRKRWSDAVLLQDAPCPNCRKKMRAGSVLCIECGHDLRTGKIRGVKIKRFERDWVAGLPIWAMVVLIALLLMEFGGLALILLARSPVLAMIVAPIALLLGTPVVALAGWFNVLHLSRDRQGDLWLSVRRHFCFIPYAFEDLPLKKFKCLVIGHRNGVDLRMAGIYLLVILPHLILMPPLIFILIRILIFRLRYQQTYSSEGGGLADTYWISLRDLRRREVRVYYGGNATLMRDLADTLSDAGDLEIVR